MKSIYINADIGEQERIEDLDHDNSLIPYLDMLNIACGGHAANQMVMSAILKEAKKYEKLVGAHPSYVDKVNFGRISQPDQQKSMNTWLTEQLALFITEVEKVGISIHHIKPHGALFHDLMLNEDLASLFMSTVSALFSDAKNRPYIVGLAHSQLQLKALEFAFPYMQEAFLDRCYLDDGNLQSRKEFGSVLTKTEALAQYKMLMQHNAVQTNTGNNLALDFQTLCVHSDSPDALEILKTILSYRS